MICFLKMEKSRKTSKAVTQMRDWKERICACFGLFAFSLILPVFTNQVWADDIKDNFTHDIIDDRADRPGKPYIKLLGDLSGDGNPDILVASAKGNGIVWYEYPAWRKHVIREEGTYSEEGKLADMDGDADLDAIIPGKSGIYWYENPLPADGKGRDPVEGKWREHFIGSDGANVHDLSVADLDKDDFPELIVRYEKELRRPLTIWFHTAGGEWESVEVSDHYGEGLAVGDIDGDGLLDMAVNELWFRNSGNGRDWVSASYTENNADQLKVVCADLNADGNDEIIISPQSWVPEGRSAKIACYFLNQGVWEEVVLQEGAREVNKVHGIAVGDMDGDGDPDVTISKRHDARDGGEISIFENVDSNGRKWSKHRISKNGSHNHVLGDIGNDGDLDIMGANWNDEAFVEVWIQN